MKKIWTNICVVFVLVSILYLGYMVITNPDEVWYFVTHNYTWLLGGIIGYLTTRKSSKKKAEN